MARRVYQFADFRLDLDARALHRVNGESVILPVRIFDCIAWLIEHRDRAVGRDELIAAIWNSAEPNDHLLVQIVSRVRKLLDDPNEAASVVRTVAGFGYQWVAPVRLLESSELVLQDDPPARDEAPVVPSEKPAAAPGRRTTPPRLTLVAGTLISCVAVGVFILYHFVLERSAIDTGDAVPSLRSGVLAVLPFGGTSASDPNLAWLRLGLMDLVVRRLREGGMTVMSSSDVVAIARDEQDPAIAADRLKGHAGIRYLVLADATQSDAGWNVHLELRDREGNPRLVQASATEVVAAARQAADQLLMRLGKFVPADGQLAASGERAAELRQHVEAAILTGRLDVARSLIQAAPSDQRDSAELQIQLGQIELKTGQIEAARDRYLAMLGHLSAESDPIARARTLTGLGATYVRSDSGALAEKSLTEAIALLANTKESGELAKSYLWRGNAFGMQGRYDEARADWAKARIAFVATGDVLSTARTDLNEGVLETHYGKAQEALELFQRAAEQFDRFGVVDDLATARAYEIYANLDLLRTDAAVQVVRQAGKRFDTLDNPLRVHLFQFAKARALLASGRLVEGRALLSALTGTVRPSESGLLATIQAVSADADWRTSSFQSALEVAQQSLAGLPEPQGAIDQWSETRALAWLAEVRALRSLDRSIEASVEVRKFSDWADKTGESLAKLQAQLAKAEQTWNEGRPEEAMAIFEELLHKAPIEGARPIDTAGILFSYGELLIRFGYMDRAVAIVGQAARFANEDFACALLQVHLYHALGQRDAWQGALENARRLAGEREIPGPIAVPPQH